MESAPFHPTRHGTAKVGKREARFPNPNPLVGHHDHATKWHKAILTAHSNAVVTARSGEMLWSKWHKHTRWFGQEREKER
jgi:hypothetical protein